MSQFRKRLVFLIDLDGTLLEAPPRRFLFANLFLMFFRFGKMFGWSRVLSSTAACMKALLGNTPQSGLTNFEVLTTEIAKRSLLSEAETQALLWKFYRQDFPRLGFLCAPVPGAGEKLKQLKAGGHRLFLATNPIWPEESVHQRLQWAKISPDLFEGMTHSQNWHACKPNPDYFEEILRVWHLDPKECLMVGDSNTKDGPAKQFGISVKILPQHKKREFWQNLSEGEISS